MTSMKDKKIKKGGYTVGTSLVLVTFVLLCLVVFATLSYSSAKADLKLSQNAADNTTKYYDANARAQEKLAKIDATINSLREEELLDEAEYFEAVFSCVQSDDVSLKSSTDGTVITYKEMINEDQYIDVEIRVNGINAKEPYSIIKWQNSSETDEEEEEGESLNLLF